MKKLLFIIMLTSSLAVFAGRGHYVAFVNDSDSPVVTSVTNSVCMYEINKLNMVLQPHQTTASIYIEDKKSDWCFFKSPQFLLEVKNSVTNETAYFHYAHFIWDLSTNSDFAYIASLTQGDQDDVKIRIVR